MVSASWTMTLAVECGRRSACAVVVATLVPGLCLVESGGLLAFLGHWSEGGLSDHTGASAPSLHHLSLPPLLHTLARQCQHLHGLQGVTVATPHFRPLHSSSGSPRHPPSASGIPSSGAQHPCSHSLPCLALHSAPPSDPHHPVPQRPCLPRSQSC